MAPGTSKLGVAERVGFEPTVELPRQQFSRLPDSAALAPLRYGRSSVGLMIEQAGEHARWTAELTVVDAVLQWLRESGIQMAEGAR